MAEDLWSEICYYLVEFIYMDLSQHLSVGYFKVISIKIIIISIKIKIISI